MKFAKLLVDIENYEKGSDEYLSFLAENDHIDSYRHDFYSSLEDVAYYLSHHRGGLKFDGKSVVLECQEGGDEGDGSNAYLVFSHGDKLYRVDGYYSSWNGVEYDGKPYEVKRVPVEIFDYVKV